MVNPLSPELSKGFRQKFFEQITGPMGGIFALGIFIGMFAMHVYMSEFVYKQRFADLQGRIVALEAEKITDRREISQLRTRLEDIALKKLED